MLWTSINRKVMIGYVAILITVTVAGWLLFQQSDRIGQTSDQFIGELLPQMQAIETINRQLDHLQLAAYAFYGTTIDVEHFDSRHLESRKEIRSNLGSLHPIDGSSTQAFTLNLGPLDDKISGLRSAMTQSPVDWDEARLQLENLEQTRAELNQTLTEEALTVRAQAQKDSAYIQAQIQKIHNSIILAGAAILLITIAAFYMARRGIAIPATGLSSQLRRMAVDMDLRAPITMTTRDELAEIADAFNLLQSTFRESVNTSKTSVDALMGSAHDLEQLSGTVSTEIHQFSHHIEQLNSRIAEFEANIFETAEKSQYASGMALSGAQQAKSGAEVVDSAARGIDELSRDLKTSGDMLLELKESGGQVGAVASTIAGIAEQTNLLALNAAIEAARAGESGRGFAVVADEVRQLANRTQDSTHQIKTILATIVQSITAVVESMDSNKAKAEHTVQAVHQTVESLKQLNPTILKLSDDNRELAQLSKSNEDIISGMRDHIARVVESNETVATGGENMHLASGQLLELAGSLRAASEKFKS